MNEYGLGASRIWPSAGRTAVVFREPDQQTLPAMTVLIVFYTNEIYKLLATVLSQPSAAAPYLLETGFVLPDLLAAAVSGPRFPEG